MRFVIDPHPMPTDGIEEIGASLTGVLDPAIDCRIDLPDSPTGVSQYLPARLAGSTRLAAASARQFSEATKILATDVLPHPAAH